MKSTLYRGKFVQQLFTGLLSALIDTFALHEKDTDFILRAGKEFNITKEDIKLVVDYDNFSKELDEKFKE